MEESLFYFIFAAAVVDRPLLKNHRCCCWLVNDDAADCESLAAVRRVRLCWHERGG